MDDWIYVAMISHNDWLD